jgi:hypothetical protein
VGATIVGLICLGLLLLSRHLSDEFRKDHTTPEPWDEDESA